MLTKNEFFNYLKKNSNKEFSKEEIINLFSNSFDEEEQIDKILSEIEVESTYQRSSLIASCKGGTVFYQWID